jgi:hypothetical protein
MTLSSIVHLTELSGRHATAAMIYSAGATGEGLRSPVFFKDTGGPKPPPVAPKVRLPLQV